MIKRAGGHGKRIVFLVSDSQLKKETFVEDLDGILNAGEVANIFEADEKAEMMEVGGFMMMILFSVVIA